MSRDPEETTDEWLLLFVLLMLMIKNVSAISDEKSIEGGRTLYTWKHGGYGIVFIQIF